MTLDEIKLRIINSNVIHNTILSCRMERINNFLFISNCAAIIILIINVVLTVLSHYDMLPAFILPEFINTVIFLIFIVLPIYKISERVIIKRIVNSITALSNNYKKYIISDAIIYYDKYNTLSDKEITELIINELLPLVGLEEY